MSGIRVLRLYHSAVVAEYRERERWLREKHGYEVHTVSPPAWPEGGSTVTAAANDSVPLHVVPVRGRRHHPILFWYDRRALRRVLAAVRPHILDVHEEPYSLAAWGAIRDADREAPGAGVCVYTAQNVLKRYPPPFRQLERSVLGRAAAAYPCSREAAEVLRRKGFPGALSVLPLGVTTDGKACVAANGRVRVGFVGRLAPEKGVHIALDAFAQAAAGLDASLEIVGAGPEEAGLRERARVLGLGQRVVFAGAVSQEEALERMRALDVLLVPSIPSRQAKEQFGRVVAQALAAGTAVVASDAGALPDVLGGCGEIARAGDVGDFAGKLGRLLRDSERRRALAEAGRRRAHAKFSWERVADGVDALYREVLARG